MITPDLEGTHRFPEEVWIAAYSTSS